VTSATSHRDPLGPNGLLIRLPALGTGCAAGLATADVILGCTTPLEPPSDPGVLPHIESRDPLNTDATASNPFDPSRTVHGMPSAAQDSTDRAGMPTGNSCPARIYMPAPDALVTTAPQAAGAVPSDTNAIGLAGVSTAHAMLQNMNYPDPMPRGSSPGSANSVSADSSAPFSRLGTCTDFVNRLDPGGLARPMAPRSDGWPGSVAPIALDGPDGLLANCGSALQPGTGHALGCTGWPLPRASQVTVAPLAGAGEIALRGARISGRLNDRAWTLPLDRFFGTGGTRTPTGGGTQEGFPCESAGAVGAEGITAGGWRAAPAAASSERGARPGRHDRPPSGTAPPVLAPQATRARARGHIRTGRSPAIGLRRSGPMLRQVARKAGKATAAVPIFRPAA
jgi:hypothetical protein